MAKKTEAADFLNMFESKPDKKMSSKNKESKTHKKENKEKKEGILTLSIEKGRENKSRYNFSFSPTTRQRLSALTKAYNKRSDSAFLEEIINQLWEQSELKD